MYGTIDRVPKGLGGLDPGGYVWDCPGTGLSPGAGEDNGGNRSGPSLSLDCAAETFVLCVNRLLFYVHTASRTTKS